MFEKVFVWIKRGLVYCLGLFIMALGVTFSVKSALGVSPVTSLAHVVSLITRIDLGICTTLSYIFYLIIEFVILRKDFKPDMLLQLIASFLFGALVSLATRLTGFIPAPQTYFLRFVFLLISIPLIAFGVMLYLSPQIWPTPGDGLPLSLSKRIDRPVPNCKIITDCGIVALSVILSLLFFRKLNGIREGTVISALTVGIVMKYFIRLCQAPILRFVERQSKLERALEDAEGVSPADESKIIVTISWELGCGGEAIAERLAKKLGIRFYGNQLIPLEAKVSGLSEEYITAHEQNMSRGVIYDLTTANYALDSENMPPLERLFAAQMKIQRSIAAQPESSVILGRCSDYILYEDPNSFRVFIHANPKYRTRRISEKRGSSLDDARYEMTHADAARRRYYEIFANRAWGRTMNYNLTLDSERFDDEGCVALIIDAIKVWCRIRGRRYPFAGHVEDRD